MKTTLTAAVLFASAAAFTSPALAMDQELTMLEAAVETVLAQHDISDVDVMSLTVSQLALINSILSSDDNATKRANRIQQVLAR